MSPEVPGAGPQISASVLLTDTTGKLLIVRRADRIRGWQLPGGDVRPGQTPRAAVRAACAALGICLQPGDLLAEQWTKPARGRARMDRIFAGPQLVPVDTAQITLRGTGLDAWRLESIDRALLLLRHDIAALVARVLTRPPGTVVYRETVANATGGPDGRPLPQGAPSRSPFTTTAHA